MPGKGQRYGMDYKNISILVSPDDHRKYRMKALELGITLADVVRVALEDERVWKAAVKAKVAAQ